MRFCTNCLFYLDISAYIFIVYFYHKYFFFKSISPDLHFEASWPFPYCADWMLRAAIGLVTYQFFLKSGKIGDSLNNMGSGKIGFPHRH